MIKKLGGGVRLALAQYRELAAFSQFASDLDEATRKQLERGQRITEVMKQKQYSPMSVAEMALALFAADQGYLDDVEVTKVVDFEAAMQSFIKSEHPEIVAKMTETLEYSDEVQEGLHAALKDFKEKGSW